MASPSTYMNLTRWTDGSDLFDYTALANNFKIIDEHNHASGKGVPIPTAGIEPLAINNGLLADNSVTAAKIAPGEIGANSLTDASISKSKIDYTTFTLVDALPSTSGLATGYTVLYTNSTSSPDYIWQLRWSGSRWDFIGGSSKVYANDSSIWMDDGFINSTPSNVTSTGKDLGVSSFSVPAGKYIIRYDALLDFKYFGSQSTAEMRVYLKNGASELSSAVIAPPTEGVSNTQLAVPVSKIGTHTFGSTATLTMVARTVYRQTGASSTTDPIASHVFKVGLSVTPLYLS